MQSSEILNNHSEVLALCKSDNVLAECEMEITSTNKLLEVDHCIKIHRYININNSIYTQYITSFVLNNDKIFIY